MAVTSSKYDLRVRNSLRKVIGEWKIIHHWVSFPTQIDKSWDTVNATQNAPHNLVKFEEMCWGLTGRDGDSISIPHGIGPLLFLRSPEPVARK